MGISCSLWGCVDEPTDFWGDNAEYVLYKCKRCRKETIFCSKELKILKNDEKGRRVMAFMMSNPEFSRDCLIHSEFIKAETDNPFSHANQERQQNEVREKYGLPAGYRQPDPLILFEKGLWKSKGVNPEDVGGKKKRSKPKGRKGRSIRIDDGESAKPKDNDGLFDPNSNGSFYNIEINFVPKNGESKPKGENFSWEINDEPKRKDSPSGFRPEMTVEAQLSRLQRRLDKHVAREEYERAAKLRDQIEKLKGENK